MSSKVTRAAGLHTSDNPYSSVPEGSFAQADNVVIRNKDVVESRRGHEKLTYSFSSGTARADEIAFFGTTPIVSKVDAGTYSLARDTGAALTDYSGTYTPPDTTLSRMKFVEAAGNFHFNTTVGNYILETTSSTPAKAGVPAALEDYDGNSRQHNTGSAGWMPANSSCAYRYVWGIKDAQNAIKLGAPSGRLVVRNRVDSPSGQVARVANVVTVTIPAYNHNFIVGDSVTLLNPTGTFGAGPFVLTAAYNPGGGGNSTFAYAEVAANATSSTALQYSAPRNSLTIAEIPTGITTSHFLRVYRSEETSNADTEPSDELFEQYEVSPTAGDIAGGTLSLTDRTPSSQLGDPLYTNEISGGGIAAAKQRPPKALDICFWQNRLWAGNTTDKQRLHIRLLGVGAPDGLQTLDSITIAGQTVTVDVSSVASFSQAQQVETMARSLVTAINGANNTVCAYYESGENSPPGMIMLEERTVGSSAFTVYASRPASWSPALTTSSSGAVTSANDRRQNGLSYSSLDEPEAFPLLNFLTVGSKTSAVLRIVPLKDQLYVFKEDGVYTVSGTSNFRVDLLDATVRLAAPDSAVVLSNRIFALTSQGVVAVTNAGAGIVSRPIERDIMPLLANSTAAFKRACFGVAYETERQYVLWLPSSSSSSTTDQAFVYHVLNNTWTRRTDTQLCGRVSPTDYLYLGAPGSATLFKERKAFTSADYADESYTPGAYTVMTSTATACSLTFADVTPFTVGDYLKSTFNASAAGPITSIVGNVVTVLTAVSFPTVASGNTATTGYKGIASVLVYNPQLGGQPPLGGQPGLSKQFKEATLHFGAAGYNLGYITTVTELNTSSTADLVTADNTAAFKNVRKTIPRASQRCAILKPGFSLREAFSTWRLFGYTVEVDGTSERTAR